MDIEALLEWLFAEAPLMKVPFEEMCKEYGVTLEDGKYGVWETGIMYAINILLSDRDTFDPVLREVFDFFEKMASNEETRAFFIIGTMGYFANYYPELLPLAEPYMGNETKRAWNDYLDFRQEEKIQELSRLHSENDQDTQAMETRNRRFGASCSVDQFAPIIPYEGAGGLKLGWTKEQVEQKVGPLGSYVLVADRWQRYTIGNLLWLFFGGADDTLEKIVTLPGYGGRLFDCIDTYTLEKDLDWKEPNLVHFIDLEVYYSHKGALLQPVDGKTVHITVFSEGLKEQYIEEWFC